MTSLSEKEQKATDVRLQFHIGSKYFDKDKIRYLLRYNPTNILDDELNTFFQMLINKWNKNPEASRVTIVIPYNGKPAIMTLTKEK